MRLGRGPGRPGVGVRRLRGVLVADRATAVVDLLRFFPFARARNIAYRALQTKAIRPEQLVAATRRLGRHAGAKQLRTILADVSTGASAESERLLIALLHRHGLSEWTADCRVELADRWIVADAAFRAHKVIIEIDGRAWHTSPDRFQSDRTRQNALVLEGWTVLRFTWEDLTKRGDRVAAEIRAALTRAARPQPG